MLWLTFTSKNNWDVFRENKLKIGLCLAGKRVSPSGRAFRKLLSLDEHQVERMPISALDPPAACYSFWPGKPSSAALHRSPFLIPAALESKGGGWQNAVIGPVLQCLEAATLGMPFEVRDTADCKKCLP